jgi:hypothetical protein
MSLITCLFISCQTAFSGAPPHCWMWLKSSSLLGAVEGRKRGGLREEILVLW